MAATTGPSAALSDTILAVTPEPQVDSPLFQELPAEVRSNIFTYALTDYPDPSPDKAYGQSTCYTRPSYFAPRKSDTALLQTCRRAYQECWFLPFLLREQIHWCVGDHDRAPPGYEVSDARRQLARTLQTIKYQQKQDFQIQHLRVFAQMFMLERGELASFLRVPYLDPQVLTLTIRHADWWHWEDDEPLRFEGSWIPTVSQHLKTGLREVRIELETLERKKDQVDEIAKQMMQKWFFKRPDGVVLYGADKEVTRWKGTSRWHNRRWTRDESAEGVIDYYIVTVIFLPERLLERNGVDAGDIAKTLAQSDDRPRDQQLKLHNPEWQRMQHPGMPYVDESRPQPTHGMSTRRGRRREVAGRRA